jgi:Na+-driven multidrug efflux pump
VGSTAPLMNMVNGFFIGISSGATVILSQNFGAGNQKAVSRALHTGVALSLVLGAMITAFGVCAAPQVLRWMSTPESCFGDASIYIRICFSGAIGSTASVVEAASAWVDIRWRQKQSNKARMPVFLLIILIPP